MLRRRASQIYARSISNPPNPNPRSDRPERGIDRFPAIRTRGMVTGIASFVGHTQHRVDSIIGRIRSRVVDSTHRRGGRRRLRPHALLPLPSPARVLLSRFRPPGDTLLRFLLRNEGVPGAPLPALRGRANSTKTGCASTTSSCCPRSRSASCRIGEWICSSTRTVSATCLRTSRATSCARCAAHPMPCGTAITRRGAIVSMTAERHRSIASIRFQSISRKSRATATRQI